MVLKGEFPTSFIVDDDFDNKPLEEGFEENEERLEGEGLDSFDEFSED